MKTLVIYTSKTGFTKKYANWLAESTDADIFELKDVLKKNKDFFDGYEAIVYAGWVMAGTVVKVKSVLQKASEWKEKRLAIMAVGGSPNDNPDIDVFLHNALTDEQREYIKAFYCQGGFDYEKMSAPSKMAMKMFTTALKNHKDEKMRQTAEYISHSYDISDKKYLEPIISYLRVE